MGTLTSDEIRDMAARIGGPQESAIIAFAAAIEAELRKRWFADAAELQYRDGDCWFRMPGEHAAERFKTGYEIRTLYSAPQENPC